MIAQRTPRMIDRVIDEWNRSIAEHQDQAEPLALDVYETEDGYRILTDIPGGNAEQIDIQLHEDVLTIKAENQRDEQDDQSVVRLQERRTGKFTRSLRFPVHVDSDKIEAEFENGVLTVHVPKAEEVKPRRIQISKR